MGLIIFLAIIAAVVLYLVGIYNGLVTARNNYKNAFAQIDVQLQRRYDLIPNLVETAKANPGDPQAMQQLSNAENQLTGTLKTLFAVSESYPDLKANQNMMQVSEELTSTENKVAFARQAYNDGVMYYNNKREVFPNSFVANMYSFSPATPWEVEAPEARKAVKVSFS